MSRLPVTHFTLHHFAHKGPPAPWSVSLDPWVLPAVGLNLEAPSCPPPQAVPATDPLLAALAGLLSRTTLSVPSASLPQTTTVTSR